MRIPLPACFAMLLLAGCAGTVVQQQTPDEGGGRVPSRPVVRQAGDTTVYDLEFAGRHDKREFLGAFTGFLGKYHFAPLAADTVRDYVSLRFVRVDTGSRTRVTEGVDSAMAVVTAPDISVTDLVTGADSVAADSAGESVVPGGEVRLYTERGFLDDVLLGLVSSTPFESPDDSVPADRDSSAAKGFLRVSQPSPTRVRIQIARELLDRTGRTVTSFDLVDAWTTLVREHPAEGMALFGQTAGLDRFVRGEEAIVAGFRILDEQTVGVRLTVDDTLALRRMRSARLLPPALRAGPYYVNAAEANTVVLLPNGRHPDGAGYLDRLIVVCGGETNPFLSYSTGKLQAAVLTREEDLEYARSRLKRNSRLLELPEDRYFLSVGLVSPEARQYLVSVIDRDVLLRSAVKAEGRILSAVEVEDSLVGQSTSLCSWSGESPVFDKPVLVAYRSDDPGSVCIAEKLLATLAPMGITCKLAGAGATGYERMLVSGGYGIAVGWVSGLVGGDPARRLRLAAVWFGGRDDESARIAECREVPLFSVKRYLLCKPDLEFEGGRLSGVYLARPR